MEVIVGVVCLVVMVMVTECEMSWVVSDANIRDGICESAWS